MKKVDSGLLFKPAGTLQGLVAFIVRAGIEDRLLFFKNQKGPNGQPLYREEEVNNAVAALPSRTDVNADDTKHGKFLGWILKQMKNRTIILPEDQDRVKGILENFIIEARTGRWPANKPKDINQFRTPGDVEEAIDMAKGVFKPQQPAQPQPGAPQQPTEIPQAQLDVLTQELGTKSAKVIYAYGVYRVIRITSGADSALLCDDSSWCARHTGTAAGYLKDGPLYLIRKSGQNFILIHFQSNQIKDRHDRQVKAAEIADLLPVLEWLVKHENKGVWPDRYDWQEITILMLSKKPTSQLNASDMLTLSKHSLGRPEFRGLILKTGDVRVLFEYAKDIVKKDDDDFRKALIVAQWDPGEKARYLYMYAKQVAKKGSDDLKQAILQTSQQRKSNQAEFIFEYARDFANDPNDTAVREAMLSTKDPFYCMLYSEEVLKKEVPEFRQVVMESGEQDYIAMYNARFAEEKPAKPKKKR